jgi:hypothetical protein
MYSYSIGPVTLPKVPRAVTNSIPVTITAIYDSEKIKNNLKNKIPQWISTLYQERPIVSRDSIKSNWIHCQADRWGSDIQYQCTHSSFIRWTIAERINCFAQIATDRTLMYLFLYFFQLVVKIEALGPSTYQQCKCQQNLLKPTKISTV